MAAKKLTPEMQRVLDIALRDGSVVAGTGAHAGHVERVSAATVVSLIRRGFLEHMYGSEGHVGGRLTDAGRAAIAASLPAYTSPSLDVTRRLVAEGPGREETAILLDLITRYQHLQSTLRYYDRRTGKPIADEAEVLRKETLRRIALLPDRESRDRWTRELYSR